MVQSMTGFGKAEGQYEGKKINVEMRALNSKNLDLIIRCPQAYKELEIGLRKTIGNLLMRGKVEVFINVVNVGEQTSSSINIPLATQYIKELKALAEATGEKSSDYIAQAMRMPDVLVSDDNSIDDQEAEYVEGLIKKACEGLINFRKQEGKALEADLKGNIDAIDNLLKKVPKYEEARIENIKERIKGNLEELEAKVDDNRFEQELIYYLEKIDINEEKMRLSNHLTYFIKTMNESDVAVGKKLGFISQEIGREINTLGAKANQADLQKIVVNMKDHLEKIKEQVLNSL